MCEIISGKTVGLANKKWLVKHEKIVTATSVFMICLFL
jgi:hypothetical protein